MECKACGETPPAGARFCPQCGGPLDTATAPAIEPALRDQVLTSLRAEHRLVTVVFADMTGSVSRTVGLGAEEATQLVNPLLEAMVELMVRYGGRIDRFLGDGVLAVFGVPTAHEDDPIRAVRAALDLRDRAEELGLAVTAGINTGRVYFGPVGSSIHEELTVMGPTVNLAARLQGAAGSGVVLLAESTREHVHRSFELSPRSLTIKGIDEPVAVFTAERLLDEPEKVRGIEGLRADLVGRDRELSALESALEGTHNPVAVVGPAGLGKSRLAAEFHATATGRGYTWLEGRSLEQTEDVPYAPLADLLARRLGSSGQAAALLSDLDELVSSGDLGSEDAHSIAPFLAQVMGVTLGEERDRPVTESSSELRKRLTIDALVTYLGARAAASPTVMFIDDLHWADELTVEVLIGLHRTTPSLVMVTAFRPEPDTAAERLTAVLGDDLTSLKLTELSPEQSRDLIRHLLTISGLPEAVEDKIVEQAQGNPFYVEELIRSLIQQGVVTRVADQWTMVGAGDEIALPESVEALVMSRFDRLPIETRRAGQVASVLDKVFTESVFTALVGPDLTANLAMLVSGGFLRIERDEPVPEYSFIHDLTRQAIYASLLPSQQAEFHERAGDAIVLIDPDDSDALAYHYERSTNDAKAVRYLFEAGRRAVDSFSTDAALGYLERGLDRAQSLPDADDWTARYRSRKGELLERMARHSEARHELEAALEHLRGDPEEETRLWRLIGQTHRLDNDYDQAHVCYDKAEEALDRVPDRDTAHAHGAWLDCQIERAFALYFGGRGRDLPQLADTVEPIAKAHGTPGQRSDLLQIRILYGFAAERFRLSPATVAMAEEALSLAREGGDPGRIANVEFMYGFALLWADRSKEAVPILERALVDARKVGDVMLENRAVSYVAIALRRVGLSKRAKEVAPDALSLADSLDDGYYRGHARGVLAWVHWNHGDVERTLEEGKAALTAWGTVTEDEHHGYGTEFAWLALWPLAAAAAERQEWTEAAERLRELLVPWERHRPPDLDEAIRAAINSPNASTLVPALDLARVHGFL